MDSARRQNDVDSKNLEHIDRICDDFEVEYKAGKSPEIEDFLTQTDEVQRSTLFLELVKLDSHYRRKRGVAVSLRDYAVRFPQYSQSLELIADEIEPNTGWRIPARYELQEVLGSGSFGTVWKAWDVVLRRFVAVKSPKHLVMSPADKRMFLNEAQAAARLAVPGVVRILDFGDNAGAVYIVSEFIEGRTLKEQLSAQRLTIQQALELCIKVSEALVSVHLAGVVHRDLKPSNILIDKSGEPQIIDFGLALRLDSESTFAESGAIVGTFSYMSVEQAQGKSTTITHHSDVYSMGAILYELLTGQVVFNGTPMQVLNAILNDAPVSPRKLNQEISHDLETVCLKALNKAVDDRYSTAKEFAEDLRRVLQNEPIKGRRISLLGKLSRWVRRHPKRSAVVAVAIGGLAFTGLFQWIQFRREFFRTHQWVSLSTTPAGATVVLIPLNPIDGKPDPKHRIDAGQSPIRMWMTPGDYLVVAYTDQQNFHEVYRRIPDHNEDDNLTSFEPHRFWTVQANGSIQLEPVKIWNQAEVTDGMASIDGASFSMGLPGSMELPPFKCRVPSYSLDTREVSFADHTATYQRAWSPLAACCPDPLQGDQALCCVYFDAAVGYAELVGKRLPTEAEYEFVASRCPPHDPKIPRTFGPVGEAGADSITVDSDVQIHGLYSNVVEWTDSWSVLYPANAARFPLPKDLEKLRTVRGGTLEHAKGQALDQDWEHGPRKRVAMDKKTWLRGLGFRCARSHHPRLSEADFEQHLEAD